MIYCEDRLLSDFLLCLSPLSEWAPQILDLEGNLEGNLNSSPKIYCSATGNPLPSHDSIELRKLDGTVLKVEARVFAFKNTLYMTEMQSKMCGMQRVDSALVS